MKTILLLLAVTAASQAQVWPSNNGNQFSNPRQVTPASTPAPQPSATFPDYEEEDEEDSSSTVSQQPASSSSISPSTTPIPTHPTQPTPAPTQSTTASTPMVPQSTPSSTGCQCVFYRECYHGKFNTNGVKQIENRSSFCPRGQVLCCPDTSTTPPTAELCGRSKNKDVSDRVGIEGNADNAEFPWMALILRDSNVKCAGSLLRPDVVLTAAHCVWNTTLTDLTLRLGEWDFQREDEPNAHQDRKIARVVSHPDYRGPSLKHHDLALLFLDRPVTSAPNIGFICLPEFDKVFDSAQCVIAGWGKDTNGAARSTMKKVKLPVVNRNTCQDNFRRLTRHGETFRLHQTFMCAGGEAGKDACEGDGGAPLMCPNPEDSTRYTQAGIVAWGEGCGVVNVPGVYTNVAKFRFWIDEQLADKNVH